MSSVIWLTGLSGSGKTTLGRACLKAAPIARGSVKYTDEDVSYELTMIDKEDLKEYRKRSQLIFQDPYAALSPRMTVRDIIAEPLEVMGLTKTREETDERVREIAAKCRLNLEHLRRFPHAFSGGQRQRISIARSLVLGPEVLICDEPVSALDVSVQAQILNLLQDLKATYHLTLVFIAHDLAVVKNVSDRVVVMYLGKMCEVATADDLYERPADPYTRLLLGSCPEPDPRAAIDDVVVDEGELPSPIDPPSGCRFRTRCPEADDVCAADEPQMRPVREDHYVACHHPLVTPVDLPIADPVGAGA